MIFWQLSPLSLRLQNKKPLLTVALVNKYFINEVITIDIVLLRPTVMLRLLINELRLI